MLYLKRIVILLKFKREKITSLRKKIRPATLAKYSINNKIVFEVIHIESRKIIFSIIKKSKTIKEISRELNFPPSSVYKKIRDLEKITLVYVEKRSILPYGRLIAHYIS